MITLRELVQRAHAALRRRGWEIRRSIPIWPSLLGAEKMPVRTVIDVGAFNGDTAQILRRWFPAAAILACEPQPIPFRQMQRWSATKRNVHVRPYAVGRSDGEMTLHSYPTMPRHSSAYAFATHPHTHPQQAFLTVPVRRLDGIVAEAGVAGPYFVKIDVEGAELDVIAGAHDTLRQTTACIVEIHMDTMFTCQPTLGQLIDVLGPHGLKYAGNLLQRPAAIGTASADALFVTHSLGTA
jgi:FkbM family methyltransferase